jgi:hypothetical protein
LSVHKILSDLSDFLEIAQYFFAQFFAKHIIR